MKHSITIFIIHLLIAACVSTQVWAEEDRPFAKVIYDDCIPVYVEIMSAKGEKNPEGMAHYLCKIVAGICSDKPSNDSCKKGIRSYDANRRESGPSELYKAAEAGKISLVKELLQIGFNPNASLGGPGWTPLMIAVANGHMDVASVLIGASANVNAKNNLGRTPLMFASSFGFTPIVELLLVKGADPNIVPNDDTGWPALTAAAQKGHSETVKVLLKHGADGTHKDKQGQTALSIAAAKGHSEVVRVLKAHGFTQ